MKEFHERRIHKRREHVQWMNFSPEKETITVDPFHEITGLLQIERSFLVEWVVRTIFYEGISLRKKLFKKIARFSTQKIDPATGVRSISFFECESCSCRGVKANCRRCTLQSPYEIIGDGCNEGGHRYQPLDCFILRELFAGQRRQSRLWTRSPVGRYSWRWWILRNKM